jgi:hypothetical protein
VQWPTFPWEAGLNTYRIFNKKYDATSFNPNKGIDPNDLERGGRFHPFDDSQGKRIATVYLADHNLAAFAETLMRKEFLGKELTVKAIEDHRLACLRADGTLNLVNLNHWKIAEAFGPVHQTLLTGENSVYAAARTMAAGIYSTTQNEHGLIWTGKQLGTPSMKCIILFKERCKELNLQQIACWPLTESTGLQRLRDAAASLRFSLPDKYK